jgi:hypothetical protein
VVGASACQTHSELRLSNVWTVASLRVLSSSVEGAAEAAKNAREVSSNASSEAA